VSSILLTNGLLLVRFAGLSVPEWLTIVLIAFALLGIVQRIARAARLP